MTPHHGNEDYVRIPQSRCLNCGAPLNAMGTADLNEPALPSPGDAVVCIRCGGVMMVGDDMRPRGMSDAEMDAMTADREWMNDIAKLVQSIHFVKHMEG